jgi:hypothetical protein
MTAEGHATPDPLAMPSDWKPAVRRAWPAVALAAGILAVLLVLATLSRETEVPLRIAVLEFVAILIPVVPGTYFLLVDPWRRSSWNVRLLELRSSGQASTLVPNSAVAGFFVYALCLVVLVFSVLTATVVRPLTDDGSALRVFATISPAAGLVAAAVLLSPLLRRRRQQGLGLSPGHVHHWWWFGGYALRWEWITEIRAATAGNARIEMLVAPPPDRAYDDEETWISRSKLFRRPKHIVVVGYLDANPTAVYYALCFYLRHPELRHELGTEASIERIQRLDFAGLEAEVIKYGRILDTGSS